MENLILVFFFQAEDGIRDAQESRGLGDVYKRQTVTLKLEELKESENNLKIKTDQLRGELNRYLLTCLLFIYCFHYLLIATFYLVLNISVIIESTSFFILHFIVFSA